MSMMIYYRCAHLHLPEITSEADFKQLLRHIASNLRHDLLANEDHDLWEAFEDIETEIETKSAPEAIDLMLDAMKVYFLDKKFGDNGMILQLESDSDNANHCDALVDALAVFFFPLCSDTHLNVFTTYHDSCTAGFSEDILYRSGDQILKASTDALIKHLFSDPAAISTLLQGTPPVGEPVQQMLRATA